MEKVGPPFAADGSLDYAESGQIKVFYSFSRSNKLTHLVPSGRSFFDTFYFCSRSPIKTSPYSTIPFGGLLRPINSPFPSSSKSFSRPTTLSVTHPTSSHPNTPDTFHLDFSYKRSRHQAKTSLLEHHPKHWQESSRSSRRIPKRRRPRHCLVIQSPKRTSFHRLRFLHGVGWEDG